MRKYAILIFSALLVFTVAFTAHRGIFAESQQSESDAVSSVLVNEIRELRQALQSLTLSNYRTQVAIEQLRFQQDRIDRLSEEIEGIRAQIENCVGESQQANETAKTFEKQVNFTADPVQRLVIEQEQKLFLLRVEDNKRREQRLRERENQLNAQLQSEQSMLYELKDKLNALERSLEAPDSRRR